MKAKSVIPKPKWLFILDKETLFLANDFEDVELVWSEDELNKTLAKKKEFKGVVVLAELNWGNECLQHFHGFEIGRQLRIKTKMLCPIILTSTLKRSYFEKKINP